MCLPRPVIERRCDTVIAPQGVLKAGRRVRKRPKPEQPGPARRPVGDIPNHRARGLAVPDLGKMACQILAEDPHPGACTVLAEHGAGFLINRPILNAAHVVPARIARHRAVSVVTIATPDETLRDIAMKYPKYCVPVKATLDDGSQYYGGIHVIQSQRVLDVLCDERPFIPFTLRDRTILVNKSKLVQIELMDLSEIKEKQDILPEVNLDYLNLNNW